MENLSPTVHLFVLSCILLATFAVLVFLAWAFCNSLSIPWICCQIYVSGLKFVVNLVRIILVALGISEAILLHNDNSSHVWFVGVILIGSINRNEALASS